MATTADLTRGVTPVSSVLMEQVMSAGSYSVISGCTASYSGANLQVTIAAGIVVFNGAPLVVAGNVVTLTADGSNPRWGWIGIASTGTATWVPGTAAASPQVPELGDYVMCHLVLVSTSMTLASNATAKNDVRVMTPLATPQKYKAAAQVITTNTTYADITAAVGTFSFPIAASEVWACELALPVSFGGTGGLKVQATGPAAPTAVSFQAMLPTSNAASERTYTWLAAVTAFSSDIANLNSAGAGSLTYLNSTNGGMLRIVGLIVNGSTAGTVTFQVAQNSSNSTSTLGAGSLFLPRRIA